MKSRSYEKNLIVGLIMILFFIVFFISLFFIMTYKIEDYQVFSCSLVKYDLVCFPSYEERKLFYANKYFYIDDKKIKYKIKEDKGVVFEQDKISTYEMVLQLDVPSKYKEHDIITMTIQTKRIQLFKIIQDVLEGD